MSFIYTSAKGNKYELNIGLEVHCEITSESKLFSRQSAKFGGEPNTQVSFLDAGFPGQLPLINEFCVEQAVKTGLGINASINLYSEFARKHYFYADLPTGYQISQFDKPIVSNGWLDILDDQGAVKRIRIERLHVEQDAGKLTHDMDATRSMVDLNRAGVGLMEIVSHPDLASAFEVGEYLKQLRALVRWLGTCDGNMDEGSMRCDVNLSLRPAGSAKMGTRSETKNVNSIKFAMATIEFEMARQAEILDSGASIVQETRLFDASTGTTRGMRSKENAIDYRYFPDPDIMPLRLSKEFVARIGAELPELPLVRRGRFIAEYGLSEYDAGELTASLELADYYESAAKASGDGKAAANWILSELFAHLGKRGIGISESPVSSENLAELVALIKNGTISGKIAKDVLAKMCESGQKALAIVEEQGLQQITDTSAITTAVEAIIASAPEQVAAYKAGKTTLFGWFVGQVLKATKGQAAPDAVNKILKEKLG